MNSNQYLREVVEALMSEELVVNGCGRGEIEFGKGEKLLLQSGNTQRGSRYLSGTLIPRHLPIHSMVLLRRVRVSLVETNLAVYIGRNGGFYIQDIPSGVHPIRFEIDRDREIRTPKEKSRARATRARKEREKSAKRYERYQRQER